MSRPEFRCMVVNGVMYISVYSHAANRVAAQLQEWAIANGKNFAGKGTFSCGEYSIHGLTALQEEPLVDMAYRWWEEELAK